MLDLLRRQARELRAQADRLVGVLDGTSSLHGDLGPRKASVELAKMHLTIEKLLDGPDLAGISKDQAAK